MANRIKIIRLQKGLTREALAKMVNTSKGQIYQLERGERRLSDVWIERIAKVLNVPQGALLSDGASLDFVAEFEMDDGTKPMTRIGMKMKAVRKIAKISAAKLAAKIGVPFATYRSWEELYKKDFLPMDKVRLLWPVLQERGVDAADIWALAGVDVHSLEMDNIEKYTLDNGQIARGIPAKEWTHPSDIAKMRFIGHTLEVAAEIIKPDGTKTLRAYIFNEDNDLVPIAGTTTKKKLSYAPGENWFSGHVDMHAKPSICNILIVLTEIVTPANTAHL